MKQINGQLHVRRRRALTLGEMLIVLAVFSILAIMFIVSSKDAIEKSRYSRVLQEQRNIVSALEEYSIRYGITPGEAQGLQALVGRTSYVPTVPMDLFDAGSKEYQYFQDEHYSLIISVGPDGDLDSKASIDRMRADQVGLATGARRILFRSNEEALQFMNKHKYDPTNGTGSDGDIISYYPH